MGHLTVAILNYNGADTLRMSIESVLDQSLKPDRLVVIDNASTDDSRQIAVDMGIEVVDADNRHKFITGLNAALKLNQDLLLFMQNDVILMENCLANMMSERPIQGFIAQPVIYQMDGKIDNAGMDYFWPGYGERRNWKWWRQDKNYIPCGLVTTICFLTDIRGYDFDPLFSPAYYEDIDFYLETKRNYRHVLIPSAGAIHRGNHTFSQSYNKREISKICRKNRRELIKKHYFEFDRWLRLTVTAGLDVVKEAFDIITNRRIS